MDIKSVLDLHQSWLNNEKDGVRANLSGADLSGADLSDADLRCANLSGANLSGADLRRADLSDADLRRADLRCANLSGANLSGADLRRADLRRANLSGADLSGADLRRANLRRADLRCANLSGANLSGADLRRADLSDADLSDADLSGADLSGAEGLLSQSDYIKANFKTTESGIIVYKTFNEHYSPNPNWKIKPNQYITENVNPNRTNDCGCGVNVGTANFVLDNTSGTVWECLIEWQDAAGIIVPYSSGGKIRAERVKLIREINREDLST